MLPLHLCNILVIANAALLVTQNRTLYDFTFFALIAPILGIHTPDLGKYGFPHFRFFQTFASHGLILIAPICMTVVERFRPTWKSLLRAMILLNTAGLCVFIINLLIGSNYM